jgi:TRAP-type transport system periplasmic protein
MRFHWQAGAAAAFVLAAGTAHAQATLQLNSWAPNHLVQNDILVGWFKEIEKASDGRIKSNLLPKAVTAPPGTLDAVKDGLADVSFILHGMMPARFTLTKVAEFAQLGDTGESNSVAYHRVYEKYLAGANEHKGVRVLTVFTHGPGNILTASRTVTKTSDLSGLKFRTGGGFPAELLKSLGAVAIIRSGTDSYELLSNGVVDATLLPYETIATLNLDRVIKHITVVPGGLYNLSWAVIMNEAKFNALPKRDQDVIAAHSGERYARAAGKAWDVKDEVGREFVRKAKIDTRQADPAFVGEIVKRSKVFEDQWVQDAQKKGVDGNVALQAFRDELKRTSAQR